MSSDLAADLLADLHAPLDRVLLCAECSHVFFMPRDTCPCCTSSSCISLAKILTVRPPRKRKKKEAT
jgi:hypothetical protein